MNAIKEFKNENKVVDESEKLSQTWFRDFKVGLLHGRMKSSEKIKQCGSLETKSLMF
jgi:RecG-like helicase